MIPLDWGTGDMFWSLLWFFLWIIWFWLLIIVFSDIFRSPDLSGWGKALWTIFVVIVPYLGVFVYLIARGGKMHDRAAKQAQAQDAATREYIKGVAGSSSSPADEISRLADLKEKGVISDAEFEAGKAKALAAG
jgi:hypothetical protein